jgi:hypothetical protein
MKIELACRTLLLACALLPFVTGCTRTDDGVRPQEQQMANRLDEITKKSGGDWSKLSSEDRDYLVKDVAQGSEQSARMLIMARAGKLKGKPGGPPGYVGPAGR